MEWIQFISGIGIGAIVAKLLDILWLQDKVQQQQKATWLRDNRLHAFADVTKELISFGLHGNGVRNPFESYAAVSMALLLLDDDTLVGRIDHFIVEMDRMNRLAGSKSTAENLEAEKLYESLVSEARDITRLLRNVVLQDRGPD